MGHPFVDLYYSLLLVYTTRLFYTVGMHLVIMRAGLTLIEVNKEFINRLIYSVCRC